MKNRLRMFAVVWAAVALVGGCAVGPKTAAPVSAEKARAALKTTLDAWQAGKTIESVTELNPPIVAQDFDWIAGKKLVSYKVNGDGKEQDANLRVEVELNLSDGGAESTKKVAYIVGTDPKLTVFRAFE